MADKLFPGAEGITGGKPHPAPRPYSWAYCEPDGVAYVYDANGKVIAFGPPEQIVKLFEGLDG